MADNKLLSVFQDLTIKAVSPATINQVRDAIIKKIHLPFRHIPEREESVFLRNDNENYIVIERIGNELPDATLFLFSPSDNYYKISNITPSFTGRLTHKKYNAILQNFVAKIIEPLNNRILTYDLTEETKTIESYLSPQAAQALRVFSETANKSTGSGHPSDKERWLKFIILAHKEETHLDAETLSRILEELLGWHDSWAHELVVEYENAMALLEQYERVA